MKISTPGSQEASRTERELAAARAVLRKAEPIESEILSEVADKLLDEILAPAETEGTAERVTVTVQLQIERSAVPG